MSRLSSLFRSIDRLLLAVFEQCIPPGTHLPSSCLDLVYGVLLSSAILGWFQPPVDTAGFVPPPDERPTIQETLERFAPQVRFHPRERYFPSSVSWYLARTEMRLDVDGGSDFTTVAAGFVSPTIIPAQQVRGTSSGGAQPSPFFLQIADEHEAAARRGDLDSAECYAHLRRRRLSGGWDIQYWFFYPYSGPLMGGPVGGAHEGDWEHITVRLDDDLRTVEKVYYAAHNSEGKWSNPSVIRFHKVVYSARHGHASYPRPGIHDRGFLPADQTADGGAVWATWKNVRLVADHNGPLPEVPWLRYSGRWGEVGSIFSGPHGPAFQHYWTKD